MLKSSTVLLVRHAEKPSSGPGLSGLLTGGAPCAHAPETRTRSHNGQRAFERASPVLREGVCCPRRPARARAATHAEDCAPWPQTPGVPAALPARQRTPWRWTPAARCARVGGREVPRSVGRRTGDLPGGVMRPTKRQRRPGAE